MATSPRLGLTLLDEGQAGGEVILNETITRLEVGFGGGAINVTQFQENAPPTIVNGQVHVVGSSPTGSFTGHANQLALAENGSYIFITPKQGQIIFNDDTSAAHLRIYIGSTWVGGTSVPDLNQTIAGPTIAEVQAISDKVDALLDALQAMGIVET